MTAANSNPDRQSRDRRRGSGRALRFRAARQAEVAGWLDQNTLVEFATVPLSAPQATAPAGHVEGAPIGLSLLGAPGADESVLATARATGVELM